MAAPQIPFAFPKSGVLKKSFPSGQSPEGKQKGKGRILSFYSESALTVHPGSLPEMGVPRLDQ